MKTISNKQLFALMLMFLMGNTGIFAIGSKAKQDAWIAILLATLMGIILVTIYLKIQQSFPDNNLIEIIERLLGSYTRVPLGLLYTCYFFYLSFLNLFNLGDFLGGYLLTGASKIIIYTLILINILYLLFSGIETIARLVELMAYFIIIPLTMAGIFLIASSTELNFNNLKPILSNGITPVAKVAFVDVLTFPFGDTVTFLMLWHYLKSRDKLNKISFITTLIGGALASLSIVNMLAILGIDLTEKLNIPIINISSLIHLGEVVHGIDPLIAIIIFITGFIKLALTSYATALSFTTTFKLKDKRLTFILFALALILATNNIFTPITFHIFQKESPQNYIQLIFELLIPIILLLISYQKKKKSI